MKLNEIDLNKLQVFLVLSQRGSMKAAAQELLRTPSAVSQSISRLEASLGVKLFHRLGTKLILTDEGRELSLQLGRYQADLGNLLQSLSRRQSELTGIVRLGLPPGFSSNRVGPVLAELLRSAPAVQARLRFLTQSELAEALSSGQLDLALSFQSLAERNRNIVSRKIYEEELVLVASATDKFFPKGRLAAADLESLPVIEYYQAPSLYSAWARHHFGKVPKIPEPRAFASTLEYVLDLVRRGVGVAVVPRDAVSAEIQQGALREMRAPSARAWMGAVWLNEAKSGYLSPASSRFRELLTHRARG